MIVIAVVASWLEFMFDIAYKLIPYTEQIPIISNMSIFSWTVLVIFLVWLFSSLHFLLLWVSNTYLLRNDGLEIRVGIWTSKSFVVGSAGFADLQVIRSVSARILNFGDIIIRTQGETDVTIEKVKNPLKVADEIREVMAHPIVRIEGQEPSGDKK
jgi:uncharacterized membrane protein YdbT with pleckstrin-like domain